MIIYIASPYSSYADKQAAVNVQIDAFATLRDLGHQPIAPLLSHYIDQRHPATYERWMQWCLAMVGACDVVVRLPGESVGADAEVAEAKRRGIPVVYGIDTFVDPGTVYEVTGDVQHLDLMAVGARAMQNIRDYFGITINGELRNYDFTIDDVRIPPGDYPPINFDDHSHRNIVDELSPLHWFGRENDGAQIRQEFYPCKADIFAATYEAVEK